jgi:hypothetical protein
MMSIIVIPPMKGNSGTSIISNLGSCLYFAVHTVSIYNNTLYKNSKVTINIYGSKEKLCNFLYCNCNFLKVLCVFTVR